MWCSLSPYSFDVSPSSTDAPHFTHDSIPMGVIPVLSTISTQYREVLHRMIASANTVYRNFLKSEEGFGFYGTVSIIGKRRSFLRVRLIWYKRNDLKYVDLQAIAWVLF